MSRYNHVNFFNVIQLLQFLNHIDCFLVPYTYSLRPLPDLGSSESPPYSLIYGSFPLNPKADPVVNGQKSLGFAIPPPFVDDDDVNDGPQKAYSCSLIQCLENDVPTVCACNFKTGNVVTFKNSCDVKKHNCRFNTEFRVILNEICPWEFESRRINKDFEIDYSDPKYYN